MTINWDDFEKIDIRVGTITKVNDFPKTKSEVGSLKSENTGSDLIRLPASDLRLLIFQH
jgi:hypothetical protein